MRTISKEQILSKVTDADIHAFVNHFDDVKWDQAFHSAKIQKDDINTNRLLLMMRSADITFKKLARKLVELNFPESRLHEIENKYYNAEDLGFAIEKTDAGIDLRVYFEIKYTKSKWYETKSIRMKNQDYHTIPLFVGYKWVHNNPRVFLTEYDFIQYMDGNQLIDRLKQISDYIPSCVINQLKNKSIDEARNYVVVEVKDVESKRFSYDIRFDVNTLYLKDFSQKEIMDKFGVSLAALHEFENNSIGHISGGKNKHGEDFFTIYFVV